MFFGFVGLFSTALLWPGLLVIHLTNSEPFELPTVRQWEYLVVNGLIGTVLSELLWLWGCFYTSSLIATLAIGLTIPLSVLADILWRQRTYETIFIVGTVPIFCSFFIIAMLTHYEDWDPLLDLCKLIWRRLRSLLCCRGGRPTTSYVFDRQERESLINQEPNSSQDEAL
jgi:solute carrier family 35 protein F5